LVIHVVSAPELSLNPIASFLILGSTLLRDVISCCYGRKGCVAGTTVSTVCVTHLAQQRSHDVTSDPGVSNVFAYCTVPAPVQYILVPVSTVVNRYTVYENAFFDVSSFDIS
jgi:hypothetical protein